MKKVVLIAFILFLVLFGLLTIFKKQSSKVAPEGEKTEMASAEKERTQNFWNEYRQATKYRIAGEWEKAAQTYQKALEFNDRHEDALYYLGNMHLVLGDNSKAEEAWTRLVQVNPNSARAHFQLGDLYLHYESEELFDLAKAEAAFQKTLELNKEETGPVLRFGQISLVKGDLDEARKYFSAVTGSNFKSVEAHFLTGYLDWKKGQTEKALSSFGLAVKYAKPDETKEKVVGEGDTKGRHAFEQQIEHTLFENQLRELPAVDEKNLKGEMKTNYQKFDTFLAKIQRIE